MSTPAPNPPAAPPTPALPVLSLFSLAGQTAVITGASRGIGAACALALAQAGLAHLVLVLRPPSGVDSVAAPALAVPSSDTSIENANDISETPIIKDLLEGAPDTRLTIVFADLSDVASVKTVFPRALGALRPGEVIDVLVHCAGIQRRAPAVQFGEQEWDEVSNIFVFFFRLLFFFWVWITFCAFAFFLSFFLAFSFPSPGHSLPQSRNRTQALRPPCALGGSHASPVGPRWNLKLTQCTSISTAYTYDLSHTHIFIPHALHRARTSPPARSVHLLRIHKTAHGTGQICMSPPTQPIGAFQIYSLEILKQE